MIKVDAYKNMFYILLFKHKIKTKQKSLLKYHLTLGYQKNSVHVFCI